MWTILKHMQGRLISPKLFFKFSQSVLPVFYLLFIILLAYGGIAGLFFVPADYLQGDAFRILYVHAPCAFLSLFIYVVMSGAAVAVLVFRLTLAPLVIKHSATLGAGFTLLALITGSLWGKPMWGTWWLWDARLTSELILFFLYLAIILCQSALAQKPRGERAVSILILVGLIDIPIIHYSVYWWNTLHQGASLKLTSSSTIDSSMIYPLLSMIAAFLLYYAIVLFLRMGHELIALNENSHWLEK
jgi:heme exporter protein C